MEQEKNNKKQEKILNNKEKIKSNKNDRYIQSIGRRKTASARVRLYQNGEGEITINKRKLEEYFPTKPIRNNIRQVLRVVNHEKDLNFSIVVSGGGKVGESIAIRHGMARALEKFDKELRPILKAKGFLTRDPREKERKKPGLKRARRAPQWSKR